VAPPGECDGSIFAAAVMRLLVAITVATCYVNITQVCGKHPTEDGYLGETVAKTRHTLQASDFSSISTIDAWAWRLRYMHCIVLYKQVTC